MFVQLKRIILSQIQTVCLIFLRLTSHSNMTPTNPIVWVEYWNEDGHNTIRINEFIKRFTLVDIIKRPATENLPFILRDDSMISRWRIWWHRHVTEPFYWEQLNQNYQFLWCGSKYLHQIDTFDGGVIVDEFDPHFDNDRIGKLNSQNVLAVVTTSLALKHALQTAGLTKPIYIIPSGYENTFLDHNLEDRIQSKKEGGECILVYPLPQIYLDEDLGDVTFKWDFLRSISFLMKAMNIVWIKNPNIQLWLVGNPSDRVKQYCNAYPQVTLHGYVPHNKLLPLIAQADIGLYPRLIDYEGRHSIKLLEYMACGCATISTDVGEAYMIQNANAGIIVSHDEDIILPSVASLPEKSKIITTKATEFSDNLINIQDRLAPSFANAILELAGDSVSRAMYAKNGIAYAQNLDWDTLSKRYENEIFQHYIKPSL